MNAKLPLALGLIAVLMLPVLAHTLTQEHTVQDTSAQVDATATVGDEKSVALAQGAIGDLNQNVGTLTVTEAAPAASAQLPARGMTMAQVEQSHGAPNARRAPVGNPPITRWEYSGFVVYFEYRHVIHAVTKRN